MAEMHLNQGHRHWQHPQPAANKVRQGVGRNSACSSQGVVAHPSPPAAPATMVPLSDIKKGMQVAAPPKHVITRAIHIADTTIHLLRVLEKYQSQLHVAHLSYALHMLLRHHYRSQEDPPEDDHARPVLDLVRSGLQTQLLATRPKELVAFMTCCAALSVHEGEFQAIGVQMCQQHASLLEPSDVSQCLSSMALLGWKHPDMVSPLTERALALCDQLKPRDITSILAAMADRALYNDPLVAGVLARALVVLDEFTPKGCALFLKAVADMPAGHKYIYLEQVEERLRSKFSHFPLKHLATITYVFAKWKPLAVDSLEVAAQVALATGPSAHPGDLALLVFALGKHVECPPHLLQQCQDLLGRAMGSCNAGGVVMIAKTYSQVGLPWSSLSQSLVARAVTLMRSGAMTVRHMVGLITVIRNSAGWEAVGPLLRALAERVVEVGPQLVTQDLMKSTVLLSRWPSCQSEVLRRLAALLGPRDLTSSWYLYGLVLGYRSHHLHLEAEAFQARRDVLLEGRRAKGQEGEAGESWTKPTGHDSGH